MLVNGIVTIKYTLQMPVNVVMQHQNSQIEKIGVRFTHAWSQFCIKKLAYIQLVTLTTTPPPWHMITSNNTFPIIDD